jgi:RsiW-degrading membrane proteinase PrsW (M82 family)
VTILTPLLALLPVLLFLGALVVLDSFKLAPLRSILRSIGAGVAVALAALLANTLLQTMLGLEPEPMRRTVGPFVEEFLKALPIVVLLRTRRVGFLVDAALHGFAVGAGFALAENVYYLLALDSPDVSVWLIRGFGTAMLHGAVTAIFAMTAKYLSDRRPPGLIWDYVPGFAVALILHILYNLVLLPPLLTTAILLAVMPLLMLVVFDRSEKATQEWLGVGLDTDVELLEAITSGEILDTEAGRYLTSLGQFFPGTVVADMLCLLRVHLELSIRAKGILIARASGVQIPVTDDIREMFEELRYLERTIGRTGRMAVMPLLRQNSSRELWQIYMLSKQVR